MSPCRMEVLEVRGSGKYSGLLRCKTFHIVWKFLKLEEVGNILDYIRCEILHIPQHERKIVEVCILYGSTRKME